LPQFVPVLRQEGHECQSGLTLSPPHASTNLFHSCSQLRPLLLPGNWKRSSDHLTGASAAVKVEMLIHCGRRRSDFPAESGSPADSPGGGALRSQR
jgi:hypothetical protein